MKVGLKQIITSFLLLWSAFSVNAQGNEVAIQRNTFFLELAGNGVFYSLNYDQIFLNQGKWKMSSRMGVMYLPYFSSNKRQMVGTPLEVSYLRGKNSHHWEVGVGFTPFYDTYLLSDSHIKNLVLMGVARVGYRHQKREGGLFYKVGLTPVQGMIYDMRYRRKRPNEVFSYPLVGLAIGYTLKK